MCLKTSAWVYTKPPSLCRSVARCGRIRPLCSGTWRPTKPRPPRSAAPNAGRPIRATRNPTGAGSAAFLLVGCRRDVSNKQHSRPNGTVTVSRTSCGRPASAIHSRDHREPSCHLRWKCPDKRGAARPPTFPWQREHSERYCHMAQGSNTPEERDQSPLGSSARTAVRRRTSSRGRAGNRNGEMGLLQARR